MIVRCNWYNKDNFLKFPKAIQQKIELAGPARALNLRCKLHESQTIQIPIKNLGLTYAHINATIIGDLTESLSLSPETAVIRNVSTYTNIFDYSMI